MHECKLILGMRPKAECPISTLHECIISLPCLLFCLLYSQHFTNEQLLCSLLLLCKVSKNEVCSICRSAAADYELYTSAIFSMQMTELDLLLKSAAALVYIRFRATFSSVLPTNFPVNANAKVFFSSEVFSSSRLL